jgi:glycosyltransferase involved in cell wall biosynthesis
MFVGGFQHPPNLDAAEWLIDEIMPRVRRDIPDARLHIIGSRMPESLRERRSEGVVMHGYVEELGPYLEGCRLSVAPLRYGAGVKGKVNQAMAWGLPVVATGCAAEGMYLADGEDVLVADDTEAFAAAIVRAYNDEALWTKLSDGGLANVEQHFSFDAARRAIVELMGVADSQNP